MESSQIFEIGDIVEFRLFGRTKTGEIADINDDDTIYFIRMPSGEIFQVNKEDVKDLC